MASASLSDRLAASLHERLRIAAVGSVGFAISFGTYDLVLHFSMSPWFHIATAGAGLLCFALAVLAHRIPFRWVSAAGTLMVVCAVTLSAWGYAVERTVDFPIFIGLVAFAAGVIHLFRRWLIVNLVLIIAVWIPVGVTTAGREFAPIGISLLIGCTITVMIHEIALRYFIALEELRLREIEHARSEQALREQLWHSQKLESIGTLAGGVAHDMNNVLAAIVGLSELIRDHPDQPCRDDLSEVLLAAQRGAELTRNLLAFSRRGTYHKVELEVAPLVDSVVKLLGRTLAKRVALEVSGAPRTRIEGDSAQLSHAIVNLCINGADAITGHGTLRLALSDCALDESAANALEVAPGNYVAIAVTDDGCGMTTEIQQRMFEPFFTTKGPGKGTGLGLAMVYGTIKSHGGALAVTSSVGRGTTITIYLPASTRQDRAPSPAPDAAPQTKEIAMSRQAPSLAPVATPAGPRVLVVDDEPLVREVTRRCMERAGFRVECACDGKEACERFASGRDFELVLLDMSMPVMGGAECFARLRQLDPAVKVILVSGYAQQEEAQACLESGAHALVAKPYTQTALMTTVTRVLDRTAAPAT